MQLPAAKDIRSSGSSESSSIGGDVEERIEIENIDIIDAVKSITDAAESLCDSRATEDKQVPEIGGVAIQAADQVQQDISLFVQRVLRRTDSRDSSSDSESRILLRKTGNEMMMEMKMNRIFDTKTTPTTRLVRLLRANTTTTENHCNRCYKRSYTLVILSNVYLDISASAACVQTNSIVHGLANLCLLQQPQQLPHQSNVEETNQKIHQVKFQRRRQCKVW
ncbi:hypothetical protein FRACYDRAFT_241297 [Fragilariopsis cylindrus CCMP1102]|uniref:Uncharacterized protein n=1 Tax=Fragilariopsis cylindrus CCMP1102 TaxID=635003 RepID=A0A1E7F981_9STRA|nr:hypothetical protein FRACYDRAFT_241297 [Fragilariopsis cylindrus CCMP1102]|eukprot:OEU14740.1 hypothetical protein FRACYDRAFT_241297 [Fragilariopsis cylindrus CCMP1102]